MPPHRGWRLFWRWRSRARLGRPRLSAEVRELIATIARANPRWGSERIRGELLKLDLVVSKRSIQRYRGRGPAHPPSQTWRTFLANHAGAIWAADLLTVQTLTFKVLYVLVVITHGRRVLVHVQRHRPSHRGLGAGASWWRPRRGGAGRASSCGTGTPSSGVTSPSALRPWVCRRC